MVIEDIKRLRNILRAKNQKEEILLQSLKELNRKIPSRSVLKSTKIGTVMWILSVDQILLTDYLDL